ncbi:hypothetical protein YPPY92_2748, partial [Yersinia pestis PY-92]
MTSLSLVTLAADTGSSI